MVNFILKNADNMIKKLTDEYKDQTVKTGKETVLCFYGDHVPSMPTTYQATNYQDEHSDYFIWSSSVNGNKSDPQTIFIESLACGTLESIKHA